MTHVGMCPPKITFYMRYQLNERAQGFSCQIPVYSAKITYGWDKSNETNAFEDTGVVAFPPKEDGTKRYRVVNWFELKIEDDEGTEYPGGGLIRYDLSQSWKPENKTIQEFKLTNNHRRKFLLK